MKLQAAVGALLLAASWMTWPVIAADQPADGKCAPSGELRFLCGMKKPEDLVALPGGRWIVASGLSTGSGLHLIDAATKKWERWLAPVATAPNPPFGKCPSQPSPDELQAHGISVRDRGRGQATLYVVNHGGKEEIADFSVGRDRETIEVFDIELSGARPVLSWRGCVSLPEKLVANSVVSGPDGSIFATVMLHPDKEIADIWKGKPTGAVYRWRPGMATFERMAGTELTGNNGIEVSPDGTTLYVSSLSAVTSFTNTNPAKRLKSVKIKDGVADNLHWAGGQLILAGQRTDMCPPSAAGVPCMSGYTVSTVDPKTLVLTSLVKGRANTEFSGTSAALLIGKSLWLGSYSANKVAYRALP